MSAAGERMVGVSERTCATCKHWTQPTARTGYADALTYTGVATVGETWTPELSDRASSRTKEADLLYGECGAITLCADMSLDEDAPLATVRDASDYVATLFTQAAFGCAMWEPSDD